MALWLVTFLLGLLQHGFADFALPVPAAYAVVGGLSLVASIVLLGIVLFGYVWQHADLNVPTARYLLFAWTCTGGLFFLSQTVALARFGPTAFPHTPTWLSELYWYFAPVGAVVFALLIWVNSEGHHYPWEANDEDETYAYEDER